MGRSGAGLEGAQEDEGSRGLNRLAKVSVDKFQALEVKSAPGGMEGAEEWKEVSGWEAGCLEDSKEMRRLNSYSRSLSQTEAEGFRTDVTDSPEMGREPYQANPRRLG